MSNEKIIPSLIIVLVIIGTFFLLSKKPKSFEVAQDDIQLQITSAPQQKDEELLLQVTTSPQKTMELKIEDTKIGTGQEVESGDTVFMHYVGTLEDGTKFDSSYDRGQPFETQIGVGQVIQGWDQGVPGMKVGGKRKLTIPSDLGYGSRGAGNIIPPNATLIFEVELVDIK